MPEAKVAKRMVEMQVVETSGVDHPAHGYEGWLVQKSAGIGRVARLNHLLEGTAVPEQKPTKDSLKKEVAASKLPADVKDFMTKSIDLAPEVDAAAKLWQALRAKSEQEDPETPSVSDPAPAAPVAAAAPAAPVAPDIFKALDDDSQAALAKATKDNPDLAKALAGIASVASSAMAKAAEERNARLDDQAIAKSRDEYGQLAIDHTVVAPALRKMAEADPTAYAIVDGVLKSAQGQLEAAGLFKELGTSSSTPAGGDAMTKAKTIADGYVAAGVVKNHAEGIAKAFAENPNLYNEHEKENR